MPRALELFYEDWLSCYISITILHALLLVILLSPFCRPRARHDRPVALELNFQDLLSLQIASPFQIRFQDYQIRRRINQRISASLDSLANLCLSRVIRSMIQAGILCTAIPTPKRRNKKKMKNRYLDYFILFSLF